MEKEQNRGVKKDVLLPFRTEREEGQNRPEKRTKKREINNKRVEILRRKWTVNVVGKDKRKKKLKTKVHVTTGTFRPRNGRRGDK